MLFRSSDAVLASAELFHRLDMAWDDACARNDDLVFTVGKLFTDAKAHSITKVPGETRFAIDFRSQDLQVLNRMVDLAQQLTREIGERRRVCFELGQFNISEPAMMSGAVQAALEAGASRLSIPQMRIASGAGHDAQDFAHAGIPSGMIFVRNEIGRAHV